MSSEKRNDVFSFHLCFTMKNISPTINNEVKLQVLIFFFYCNSMNNSRLRKTLNYISDKHNHPSEC